MEAAYVFALKPCKELYSNVQEIKDKIKDFSKDNLYLNDPPHLTLYVGKFSDFLNEKSETFILDLSKKFSNNKIEIDQVKIFNKDPITKKETIYFPIEKGLDWLRLLQGEIIDFMKDYKSNEILARYDLIKDDLPPILLNNLMKTGYPFVGDIWIPHMSIGSFSSEEVDKISHLANKLLKKGEYPLESLVIYELNEDTEKIKTLKEFKFK